MHLVAEFLEALADKLGGLGLVEAQLRVGVQVLEGGFQAVALGFGQLVDTLGMSWFKSTAKGRQPIVSLILIFGTCVNAFVISKADEDKTHVPVVVVTM